jgi:hypothetical protein
MRLPENAHLPAETAGSKELRLSASGGLASSPALLNSRHARRRSRFNRVNHCGVLLCTPLADTALWRWFLGISSRSKVCGMDIFHQPQKKPLFRQSLWQICNSVISHTSVEPLKRINSVEFCEAEPTES